MYISVTLRLPWIYNRRFGRKQSPNSLWRSNSEHSEILEFAKTYVLSKTNRFETTYSKRLREPLGRSGLESLSKASKLDFQMFKIVILQDRGRPQGNINKKRQRQGQRQ